MSARLIWGVAAVAAALFFDPSAADAQQRRGPQAPQAAPQAEKGQENGRTTPPAGLVSAFEGRTPPDALQQRFPGLRPPPPPPAPEPEPEPAPEPGADECDIGFAMVDGQYVMVDCEGNVVSP